MTDVLPSPEAARYLASLEAALAPAPAGTRDEIVAGVREELFGLDAAQTSERIAELGDPEFIAATALAELAADRATGDSPTAAASSPSSATHEPGTAPGARTTPAEPRWFSTTAALLLLIGSVVVPFIAPVIGLGMMWTSRAWTRSEKWIATLAPVVVAVVLAAILSVWMLVQGPTDTAGSSGLSWWHLAIVAVFLTPMAVGGWLLWRASCNRADAEASLTARPLPTA
jgi:hypothetical protein